MQRLDPRDQARVDEYLNAPQHRRTRRPFRPWLLLGVLLACVLALGVLSRWLAELAH